jgi:hypothetical protein
MGIDFELIPEIREYVWIAKDSGELNLKLSL